MDVVIERCSGQTMDTRAVTPESVPELLAEVEGEEDVTLSFGLVPPSEDVDLIVAATHMGFVFTWFHEGDFWQLVAAPDAVGEARLTMGGQPTPIPRRWLVTRGEAVRLLAHYVAQRSFPEGLVWEMG